MIEGINNRTDCQNLKKAIDDLKYNLGNLSRDFFKFRNEMRQSKEMKNNSKWLIQNNQGKSEKLSTTPHFMNGEVNSEKWKTCRK